LAKALASSLAPLVLVSLGTNDSVSSELAAEFPGNAQQLAERLAAAKRQAVWLMPPKNARSVAWTLQQPAFDTLGAPAGLVLDATGHPKGDGYERWAASIVASFAE
jgi:lysophospholipase L1-like esterase